MPRRHTHCQPPTQPTPPAPPTLVSRPARSARRRLLRPAETLLATLLVAGLGCASGGVTSDGTAGAPAAGPLDCGSVAKLDRLFEPGTVVLFGEIHGTRQIPEFFSDAVCGALKAGHPVMVGLEMPASVDEPLRTYLHSAGDPEDLKALLASSPFWTREYQDGRASRANLELVKDLRRWAAAGLPVEAFAFDGARVFPDAQTREEEMARRLTAAIRGAGENTLVFALTGNVHARMGGGSPWDPRFRPMGELAEAALPDRRWIALNASSQGGTAWTCTGSSVESCGSHRIGGTGPGARSLDVGPRGRGVAYNGTFHVGRVTSSSPAAAGDGDDG